MVTIKKSKNRNKRERGSVIYVIDHTNQKIKKFSSQELESFLNNIIKKQYLFVSNKQKAKQLIKKITKV